MNDCDRRLKGVVHGREDLPPGHDLPRHRHLHAYALVVIRGGFDQVGYGGRVRVGAGDLLVQPTLDAHANRMPGTRGATILRLAWPDADDLGGVFALPDLDAIVRSAERDPCEAAALTREQWSGLVRRGPADDLPDRLAAEIIAGGAGSLTRWAAERGVARETASRAFSTAFAVSARRFRAELRARAAWLRVVGGDQPLAEIAAAAGFADQAHMTRSIGALTGAPPAVWRRAAAGENPSTATTIGMARSSP